MGTIKRAAKALICLGFAVILITVSTVSALAISVDGMIAPDEMTDCNIEVQCSNENGGNGICTLVTYFALQEDGSLYVALNTDFSRITITEESPIAFEIFIDDKQTISIDILGNAEYDEQIFGVKCDANFTDSGASCEAVISLKYRHDDIPEIRVRVVDNDGIPSKLFTVDTTVAAETDSDKGISDGKKPSANPSKSESGKTSSSKKPKTSSSKSSSSKSSSSKKNTSKSADDTTAEATRNYDVPQETYTMPSDMPTGTQMASFSDAVKILCGVIVAATILSGAVLVFFKIKKREIEMKKKAKEKAEEEKAERKSADNKKK